jgi:hypothetical protein
MFLLLLLLQLLCPYYLSCCCRSRRGSCLCCLLFPLPFQPHRGYALTGCSEGCCMVLLAVA